MLEYGFANEHSSAEVKAASKVWFEALSAHEQAFFHQILPFMLMSAGVGKICSQTAQLIATRVNVASPGWIDELAGVLGLPDEDRVEAFAKLLFEKFTGYRANISNEGNRDWMSRHTRNLAKADPSADDDKVRFNVRARQIPDCRAADLKDAQRCFDKERDARIAATPIQAEVEVCVG